MDEAGRNLTLVIRKGSFELPTACPTCLPVFIYLKFAKLPFNVEYNLIYPDSDQIPYVETGAYNVAYNNENGGVIEKLRGARIVDLDSEVYNIPEWVATKAMVETWLADAVLYELWMGSDGSSANKIYYSDLPWPIGKFMYYKQIIHVKQQLGITKENAERREQEIYKKATTAYGALSTRLGEQSFFFENGPTGLDAAFLGHALFTLYALPETSVLRSKLLEHANLVKYAENLKMEFIDVDSSPSSLRPSQSDPSTSTARRGSSSWRSTPKSKPKREKTEEEKKFRRRAKYFLATQLVAVLVFLSLLGGSNDAELELGDDDDGGISYD